jgi:peptidyl-prolyl cis-trans isomerase C
MSKTLRLTAAFLALTAFTAPAQAQDASTVVATVGDQDITLGQVIEAFSTLPAQYAGLPDDVLFQGLVNQLTDQAALGLTVSGDLTVGEQARIKNARIAALTAIALDRARNADPITGDKVKEIYQTQYVDVPAQTEWNANHILVETEEAANAVLALVNDGGDFEELAKEHSTGPSGPNGGALGWFGAGQMVQPFDEAVQAMEVGQVAGPVQTQFGWHLIKLNETRDAPPPALEAVQGQIIQDLEAQVQENAVTAAREAAEVTLMTEGMDPALVRNLDLLNGE